MDKSEIAANEPNLRTTLAEVQAHIDKLEPDYLSFCARRDELTGLLSQLDEPVAEAEDVSEESPPEETRDESDIEESDDSEEEPVAEEGDPTPESDE